MKRKALWSAVVLAIGSVALSAVAQSTRPPGIPGDPGGGGGHEPPTTEAVNNLSYPAVLTGGTVTLPGLPGQWSLGGVFPTSMSYGCATPEVIGTSTYPNKSCVSSTGEPLPLAECASACGSVPVERIYWQKQAVNAWQAENFVLTPVAADFADWGDNLEAVTWTASSVIRVETTPFVDTATLATPVLQAGFQMWHVFGQGPSELWGVRATNPAAPEEPPTEPPTTPRTGLPGLPTLPTRGGAAVGGLDTTVPHDVAAAVPYGYETGYAIIRSPNARLVLTKLDPAAETCGAPTPYGASFAWDPIGHAWLGATTISDASFTPELNIGGKFVYGYNWQTRSMVMPAGVEKAGWWRLTFYSTDILFKTTTVTTPPVLPDSAPMTPTSVIAQIAAEETSPVYIPVVDPLNHITYLDICLNPDRGGIGGVGGGGPRR